MMGSLEHYKEPLSKLLWGSLDNSMAKEVSTFQCYQENGVIMEKRKVKVNLCERKHIAMLYIFGKNKIRTCNAANVPKSLGVNNLAKIASDVICST